MPYFTDLNTYLHQSSLLLQAYPSARITTKYTLPKAPSEKQKSKSKPGPDAEAAEATGSSLKRDPTATLTMKTYEAASGICLKYKTDKAAEVGRLMAGMGRLAKGEIIEMPAAVLPGVDADQQGDKMEVDSAPVTGVESGTATPVPAVPSGGGGPKGKKKKGKK